jgi:hypothetical protein
MQTFASALLLIVALLQVTFADKMTIQIEPKKSECFYFDASAGQTMQLSFFVTRGGLLDIDLKVNGPDNQQLYAGLIFESSIQVFTASRAGAYEFCFSNAMARWTPKIISFELKVDLESEKKDPLSKSSLDPIEQTINRIRDSLDQIQKDQKYLRIREQKHRDTAESTNSRVLWFSIFESSILLGLTLGQVFYLRKVFDTKRPI